jgi:hypothetical protein
MVFYMKVFAFLAALLACSPAYSASLEDESRAAQAEAAKGADIDLGDQDPATLMDGLEGRWFFIMGDLKNFDKYMAFTCEKHGSDIVDVTNNGFNMQRYFPIPGSPTKERVLVSSKYNRFSDGTYLRFVPNNMLLAMGINEKSDPTGQSTIRFLASRANIGKFIRPSENTFIVSGEGWSEVYGRCP